MEGGGEGDGGSEMRGKMGYGEGSGVGA